MWQCIKNPTAGTDVSLAPVDHAFDNALQSVNICAVLIRGRLTVTELQVQRNEGLRDTTAR